MRTLERSFVEACLVGFAPRLAQLGGVDFAAAFDAMRRKSTRRAAFGLRVALLVVWLAPIYVTGRLRTLTSLGVDERAVLLDRLLHHRFYVVRELCVLLKLIAALALFASPAVRDASAYGGAARFDDETVLESGERPARHANVIPLRRPARRA